jgi:hypothetical protein
MRYLTLGPKGFKSVWRKKSDDRRAEELVNELTAAGNCTLSVLCTNSVTEVKYVKGWNKMSDE